MKKRIVLITLLGSIFTSFTSAEALKYSIPFSYYQGAERVHCFWINNCKPLPPILVTGNYQRYIDTSIFSQKFGIKVPEDLGNGGFGYPYYPTSQNSSVYYKFLRKEYLYIVRTDALLFDPCHQNRSGKCQRMPLEIDIKKS